MKVIGITGPIGSGKTYFSEFLVSKGVCVINSDNVYHLLINNESELTKEIILQFGESVKNQNGGIDRLALGSIVFSDKELLKKLNTITHKAVINKILSEIEQHKENGDELIGIEVPLLFESGFEKFCDIVISIVANDEIRLERICKRDGCDIETAQKKMKSQKEIEFYIAKSTKTLYNNNTEEFNVQKEQLWKEICKA